MFAGFLVHVFKFDPWRPVISREIKSETFQILDRRPERQIQS